MNSSLDRSMPNAASSSNTSADGAEMLDQHLRRLAALMLDALHATLSHRDRLEVTVKSSPHDLVSDADRSIERLIFDFTRAVFPEDGFLGEEGGWANRSMDGRNWVVDPVDGTMNFVHGFPIACSSVGVLEAGRAIAGLVVDPYRDDVYLACHGVHGSQKNDKTISVSPGGDLAGQIVLIEVPSGVSPSVLGPVQDSVIAAGGSPRTIGSGALALALVASGVVHGVVHAGPSIWDVAGGIALVEHAGGTVLSRHGSYVFGESGPLVAASPEAAHRLQATLLSCVFADSGGS